MCNHFNFYVNALAAVLAHQTPSHVWDYRSFANLAAKTRVITRQDAHGIVFDRFHVFLWDKTLSALS